MPNIRKYRRDTTEVSCCLKYVIFGVNVLFWVSTPLLSLFNVFTNIVFELLMSSFKYYLPHFELIFFC